MTRKSIPILYEDDDILVINKPAGLVVHSDGRTDEPTLVDWILEHYPKIKGVGDMGELEGKNYELSKKEKPHNSEFRSPNSSLRPGIIHRLDRETSGALIIIKNQKAFWFFKKKFKKQEVHKEYHAFVYGKVKQDDGLINRPIARSRTNPTLWSATRGRKGTDREAITEYRVVSRGSAHTLLELFPRTGRTHQIRVHLKAINYSIVCDKKYAPKLPCELGFNRLALHSKAISFTLPSGEKKRVEAPYPADFKRALKEMAKER